MRIVKVILLFVSAIISTSSFAARPLDWEKFDTKAFAVIQKEAGTKLKYLDRNEHMKWADVLNNIRVGKYQATGSATITAERKTWAKFTSGYRMEEEVAFMSNGAARKMAKNLDKSLHSELATSDFIRYVRANKLTVGVLKGARHAAPAWDAFVKDPANAKYIVSAGSDWDHVNLLLNGKVDLITMDRVKANGLVYSKGKQGEYREMRISAKTPVSYIINKDVSNGVIEQLNVAINKLTLDGTLSKMAEDYLKGK